MIKFLNYNVNGIRAAAKKGLFEFIEKENPDFVSLEEVKSFKDQAPLGDLKKEYSVIWHAAERKGYSGTAVFAKKQPLSVTNENFKDGMNTEGRLIALEYENFYLVSVYTPNAGDGLKRLDFRMEWDDCFREFICDLDKKKPLIITGDLNVAHNEIDIKNPTTNHKSPGFTDEERASFTKTLSLGFKDTFRTLYPDKVEYSWYSYRFKAKEKGIGWRIDYYLVSDRIMDRVKDSYIIQEPSCSDHQPIVLEIDV